MYQNSPCLFCPSPTPALRFIFPRKPGSICTKESQRLTAHPDLVLLAKGVKVLNREEL